MATGVKRRPARGDAADASLTERAYRALSYVAGFISAAQRLSQLDAPRAAALRAAAPIDPISTH
mgnify:CR=1 FL=1